jgi:simple sugar transport system ATP-binding protein
MDGTEDGRGVGPLLRARGIEKFFGPVHALKHVDFEVRPNEIVALIGDNGAGKSTLIKVIAAVLRPDAGQIHLDGAPVAFSSPAAARAAGIETVYQDLALAGNMPVWANVFLGRERLRGPRWLHLLDKRGMATAAHELLTRFRINVPPMDAPVAALSGGQRQAIAIARAAAWGSKVIVMDEPTAALGVAETRAVEALIRELRERGFGLLVVSHNLDQVFRLTDRICVLRRGEMVGHRETARVTPEEIVAMITGAMPSIRSGFA